MKRWHAKIIGECDVHRDIYEEGNPKPIAEHVMFPQANALVAAHNGEQDGTTEQRLLNKAAELLAPLSGDLDVDLWLRTYDANRHASSTTTPQGQSRSETGATESDEQIAREAEKNLRSYGIWAEPRFWHGLYQEILSVITRANKARDEQSAPAAEQGGRCAVCDLSFPNIADHMALHRAAPSPAQEKPHSTDWTCTNHTDEERKAVSMACPVCLMFGASRRARRAQEKPVEALIELWSKDLGYNSASPIDAWQLKQPPLSLPHHRRQRT